MDWKTTALVVIDMENAFISKESPLCIQEAAKSVPACGRVIRKARERGIPVFFVNRIYRRNGSDVEFTRYDSWLGGNRYLAPNSTGALSIEVPAEFTPQKGDYTIIKPRFSAFPDRAGFNSAPSGRENCDSDRNNHPELHPYLLL